ncbi:MAG TPA: HK97 gp10 family phage protein [Streptosporangiaceae bacterium]|nr:HK97 gp10 family phage protein [Streptosporangiaceae bacterium]
MDLAGFAGEVRLLAGRAEAALAGECARTAAREFLGALQVTTPVETGALRASEHVLTVSGGGTVAVAVVGSELIYAKFRNDGGTIHSKGPWSLRRGNTYFGRHVTQRGSHYMENAEALAAGPIAAACAAYLGEFLTL